MQNNNLLAIASNNLNTAAIVIDTLQDPDDIIKAVRKLIVDARKLIHEAQQDNSPLSQQRPEPDIPLMPKFPEHMPAPYKWPEYDPPYRLGDNPPKTAPIWMAGGGRIEDTRIGAGQQLL